MSEIQDISDPKEDQKSSAQGDAESAFLPLARMSVQEYRTWHEQLRPSIPDEKHQPQNTRNGKNTLWSPLLKLFCCKTVQKILHKWCLAKPKEQRCG